MKNWPANNVKMRNVSDLVPYARNTRRHPDKQIKQIMASITEWGWTIPILLDDEDSVIAGHGRLEAAQRLGLEKVPCMEAKDWTDAQKKAYRIADNRLVEMGEWDSELLRLELEEIKNLGFELEHTGFSDVMPEPLAVEDFDIPETDPNIVVRLSIPGSVWLGKRQEILDIVARIEKAYLAKVSVDE
jgi:hypothetical protein